MRTLIKCALAASLLTAATASQAQLYWRIDGGWSMSQDANIRDKNFDQDGFICGDELCNSGGQLNDVGNSPVLQGGVGWRFSPSFRMDATLGYRGGYALDDRDNSPSDFKADITSLALMGNAYWDFNLDGVKPYVGVGLGVAQNKIDRIRNTAGPFSAELPGGTSTDMAWALMAGVTFQLSSSMALDVGYRYIDLGKIESDSGDTTCSPACFTGTYSGLSGKLRAHELMIGLRF
jgi:opacity protein-like surface antigen